MVTNQDNQSAAGSPVVWGILMLICGILAVAVPLISSIGIVILVGWLILFAGVFHLIFAFHTHRIGGVLWQLLLAGVYGFAGIYMLVRPLFGLLSLTLVLAIFLLFEAVFEIGLFFAIRHIKHAGWVLFNGIVTLALGILIWAQWPSSSSWVLGTLIGISLIFSGMSRLMLSASIRHHAHAQAGPVV